MIIPYNDFTYLYRNTLKVQHSVFTRLDGMYISFVDLGSVQYAHHGRDAFVFSSQDSANWEHDIDWIIDNILVAGEARDALGHPYPYFCWLVEFIRKELIINKEKHSENV